MIENKNRGRKEVPGHKIFLLKISLPLLSGS
jgi:hypothetical protein